MNVKELRDKLVEKRTLYRNAVAECENACIEIKKIFRDFDEETIRLLKAEGFDVEPVLNVDLDKLKEEPEQLEEYAGQLADITQRLNRYLEEKLND